MYPHKEADDKVLFHLNHVVKIRKFTIVVRDYSFSTYARFSKKLPFPTPDTHRYLCVSGGKKCSFFEKFACVLNERSLIVSPETDIIINSIYHFNHLIYFQSKELLFITGRSNAKSIAPANNLSGVMEHDVNRRFTDCSCSSRS